MMFYTIFRQKLWCWKFFQNLKQKQKFFLKFWLFLIEKNEVFCFLFLLLDSQKWRRIITLKVRFGISTVYSSLNNIRPVMLMILFLFQVFFLIFIFLHSKFFEALSRKWMKIFFFRSWACNRIPDGLFRAGKASAFRRRLWICRVCSVFFSANHDSIAIHDSISVS